VTFPNQPPKRFVRETIAPLSGEMVGCYGLFRRERWVYIGGGGIRAGLLAHLAGDHPWSTDDAPTHWVAVETADYEATAQQLICACRPCCNTNPTSRGAS
jgi:hypothetical protein